MQKDIVFALKIENAELEQISLTDLAALLKNYAQALGEDHLTFQSIRAGSIFIESKTFATEQAAKIDNLNQAIAKNSPNIRAIEDIVRKYPNWGKTSFITKHHNDTDACATVLHTIKPHQKPFAFSQAETFRGRFLGIQEGVKDKDRGTFLLTNQQTISFHTSPELAKRLNSLFRENITIELKGEAKYMYHDYNNIRLERFFVDSFAIIEDTNISTWIDEFKNAGKSGWSELENPVEHWLKERHA